MVAIPVKRKNERQNAQQDQSSPEPPVNDKEFVPSAAGFEFNELNRATEVARWFQDTIIPLLKKNGFSDDMVLAFTAAFSTRLSTLALRKYQMSVSSISLAKAIEIIDEELPKLIKQANEPVDIDSVIKAWNVLKDFAKRIGGGGNG